jgi:hypothetical protein
MSSFESRLSRALQVAAGMGIVLRLLLPWTSESFLLSYVVSDDAFYYLTIARNVTAGLGVTFDGLTVTNGFHPLWLICLLPVYTLAGASPLVAMRLSLGLGTLFGSAAVLVLGYVVRRWTGRAWVGWLASALFALNPYAVLESANGLETSLALLMLSIVLAQIHREQSQPARWWLFGVAGGALVWARSDMALVLMGLYGYLLMTRRATLYQLLLAGSVTTVIVGLWLGWSWAVVGTPIQSSAVAIPWLFRARMQDAIETGWMTPGQVRARIWQHFVQVTLYQMLNYAGIGLVAGLFGLIVRVMQRGSSRRQREAVPGWLWWGGAGTLLMLALSEFTRFSLREWYIVPLALWSGVFGAGVLARWAEIPRLRTALVIVCVVLVLLAVGQSWRDLRNPGRYWFQLDQLAAARWLAANTAPDDVVGSWTAGIYGYYAERRVVNLDGVVNWDAIAAYRARELYAYMREQEIAWVADFDEFVIDFVRFYGADPADFMVPVTRFEAAQAPFGGLVVYAVEP